MTVGRIVLSGRTVFLKTARAFRPLSTHMVAKVDVRTRAPETKTCAMIVPVQLGLIEKVPAILSTAAEPPTLLVCLPKKKGFGPPPQQEPDRIDQCSIRLG